jgi:hypothetical protein
MNRGLKIFRDQIHRSLGTNLNKKRPVKHQITADSPYSPQNIYNRIKNPRTEGEQMVRSIAIGLGICSVGIIASIIGLR